MGIPPGGQGGPLLARGLQEGTRALCGVLDVQAAVPLGALEMVSLRLSFRAAALLLQRPGVWFPFCLGAGSWVQISCETCFWVALLVSKSPPGSSPLFQLGRCRSVKEFEKLNRIGEGTYGIVCEWLDGRSAATRAGQGCR